MEELYRRVGRQTMGSVVGELRGTLGELGCSTSSSAIQDKAPLQAARPPVADARRAVRAGPGQAAQAVLRMRERGKIIVMKSGNAPGPPAVRLLGNNLGARFLIDISITADAGRSCSL
jgi:chemosensory pili system protein ChpA (sensor histidine kinase/response regulator)